MEEKKDRKAIEVITSYRILVSTGMITPGESMIIIKRIIDKYGKDLSPLRK